MAHKMLYEARDIVKMTLTIPGTLPGLNEYIGANRNNKYAGAQMKHQAEAVIMKAIKSQLRGKFNKPVTMAYTWYEPTRRRDHDNVSFAKKFIQDALVTSGILKNDGWNEIVGFSDSFRVDKKNPRVVVEITEVPDEA